MTITKVILDRNTDTTKPKLLAIATIHLDYGFAIHDIKVMNGAKGEYLIFPKDKLDRFITYPIKNETRKYILEEIVKELRKEV